MSILSVERVTKSFGGVIALLDVDLEVPEGVIFGVVGPNGAGKTTLISIITGYERVNKGRIIYQGRDISKLPPNRRVLMGITRTFQIPQHFAGLTVRQNIMIPLLLRFSRAEAEMQATAIAERMYLGDDLAKESQMLPIGKLKLLELARAYATGPRLLLVDEPMGGLSADRIDSLISTIKEIREEGVTIILVEHVMKAVVSLADDMIVLNFGEKLAAGSPNEVMCRREVIEAYLGEEYART